MLLFQKRFHAGLVDGTITRTLRIWESPHVKPGGRYRVHPIGVVQVDALEKITVKDLTVDDALKSGFVTLDELRAYMAPRAEAGLVETLQVFRVTLHHAGEEDRVESALDDNLTPEVLATLKKTLAKLDQNFTNGATGKWTLKVMLMIQKRPRVAASKLAKTLKRETLPFKVDVRKLKKLGLTQSLEVGYQLTPRGIALLKKLKRW